MKYLNKIESTFEAVDYEVMKLCYLIKRNYRSISDEFLFVIEFVLREVFNNAIEHGNELKPYLFLEYNIFIDQEGISLEVRDQGSTFEISKNFNFEKFEDGIQNRNRGIQTIKDLGFSIEVNGGVTLVEYTFQEREMYKFEEERLMELKYEGDVLTIILNENLIAPNIKDIVERCNEVTSEVSENIKIICIDLTNTRSIDSMGITFLIGFYKTLAMKNLKLRVTGVSDSIRNLLKVMKLDTVFEIS